MTERTNKPRGLGRGLSALMADIPAQVTEPSQSAPSDMRIPIEKIVPNPEQPRRTFDQSALEELANSIRAKGVIQPLIVRKSPDSDTYEIVAGERRWRASQIAQLHDVPVVVRDFTDTEVLEVAIIENIQRADLNPVDEATGYRQLMDRFGHTQEQVATALGKSRSHIANHLRLLTLPKDVLAWLNDGKLSAGHARALVGQDDASEMAAHVIRKQLSVRETEKLVKTGLNPPKAHRVATKKKDPDTLQIEGELSSTLKMPVNIQHNAGTEGGKLTISYRNLEQLDDLMRILGGG